MENIKTSQVDLRQSPAYGQYMQTMGWKVIKIGDIQIFIKRLWIFGSIAKIQRVHLPLPWAKIQPILKSHRVWMTKLEPINVHPAPKGFRQDKWPLLATKTLRIDLTKSFQFKKDARYSLRRAQSNKGKKTQRNDFYEFYELWKKANGVKKLWTPSKEHFDSLVKSFSENSYCVTINNLAGALVLIHDRVAYYYYAAALPDAKRGSLPYLVIWECLQEAKRRDCTIWDWEGIFDSRWPNKSWQGFTHFKKSFGGLEILLPGSFTKWL